MSQIESLESQIALLRDQYDSAIKNYKNSVAAIEAQQKAVPLINGNRNYTEINRLAEIKRRLTPGTTEISKKITELGKQLAVEKQKLNTLKIGPLETDTNVIPTSTNIIKTETNPLLIAGGLLLAAIILR